LMVSKVAGLILHKNESETNFQNYMITKYQNASNGHMLVESE